MTTRRGEPIEPEYQAVEDLLRPLAEATYGYGSSDAEALARALVAAWHDEKAHSPTLPMHG